MSASGRRGRWLALWAGCWVMGVGCHFSPDLSRFEPCAADGSCATGATCLLPERRCLPDCLDCPPGEDAGDDGGEDGGDSGVETDAGQDGGEDAGTELDAGTLTVCPTELMYGVEGVAYEVGFEVDGGTPPYLFAHAAPLPSGMALSDAGAFSGTPPAVGAFTLQAQVQDSSEPPLSFDLALPWAVHPKLRVAGPGELATAANNAAYSEGLSATGGIAPYQFRVVAGTLPGSIQLELDGGVNGVPGGAANLSFTVEVSDSATPPQVDQRALNFHSAAAPLGLKIMTRGFPDARVGWPYSYRLQARGGTPPYTWSFPSGTFPTGVTLNQDTGEVSGTPTGPGAVTVNIKVVDSLLGSTAPTQFEIDVLP